ncbi:MAG: excinuclease ABC subunit UvrC [Pseudomonadales bacterium]|nr:excinuclease ABC subunit UvrC [Pseudomonadales bacterium]
MNTSQADPEVFDPREFVANAPRRPGVYRMYGADGKLLYVGKARSLRDRLSSYLVASNVNPRVQLLVGRIAHIEVTVTRSETEALLLEYNLIKEHKPPFNVVLRDDKSFPYIHLATSHDFPRLIYYRGSRQQPGRYFGPFPDPGAVRETLHHLQKVFGIRNCRDSFFANRSRPCLQHQIGRCTAPCVGLISQEDYARNVAAAVKILEGRDSEVNEELARRMNEAAVQLDYERAAELRDQLAALKLVQAQQVVAAEGDRDVDVAAIVGEPGDYAVTMMLIRGGRSLGATGYFPKGSLADPDEALTSFLMQFYAEHDPAPDVLLNIDVPGVAALAEALSGRAASTIGVRRPTRGLPLKWVEMARENAEHALRMRRARKQGLDEMFEALATLLELPGPPRRIECFDISHTGGEGTIASCVVFGPEGPLKKEYRRFNIEGVMPGDDYAALAQALRRRFTRIKAGEVPAPDVLFIDGGAGQIAEVRAVLLELGFPSQLLVGVAKGVDRKPGQERLHVFGRKQPLIPGADSAGLRLVQRLRDEAHRFAISGHRRRRARRHNESILETVPGMGPAKRRSLLTHFGGLQGVLRAGVADFERVPGIGASLARTLYDHLHPGE